MLSLFKALIVEVMGVVTCASGFAKFIFNFIVSYPAATVPEVQPYATQSIF